MATDYSAQNSPPSYTTEAKDQPPHQPQSLAEGLFGQPVAVVSDDSNSLNQQLDQLNQLRDALKQATLTHIRQQLSQTLPTEQVNRIIDHPNVELELRRLIHRVSLEAHPDINSLSYTIAQGLTQITEPHVRLAINLSHTGENIKPEDALQEIIKNDAGVQRSFDPLKNDFQPAEPNSSTSKLSQRLKNSLVNGPDQVPTLKPAIDKIVALGAKDADTVKQTQIADQLHQDLLAQLLTRQPTTPTNTADLAKTYLQKHGLSPDQIDSQSLNHFVSYVSLFHEVISQEPDIGNLQIVAEANNISGENLQDILRQTDQTPQQLFVDLTTSSSPTSSTSNQNALPPPTNLSPSHINQAINHADQYTYLSTSTTQSFSLRQTVNLIRYFVNQTQSTQQSFGQIRQIINIFRQGFTFTPTEGFSFNLGNIIKGFSGGGNSFSSIFGGLSKLGKLFGLGGSSAGAAAGATAAGTTAAGTTAAATTAAVAASEIWIPILIIGLIVLLVLLVVFFGANIIVSTNISPVGGQGGNIESELVSNPFIDLTKTGSPGQMSQPTGNITYTYTITPKQGPLTNVTLTNETISVFTQNGTFEYPISAPPPPTTIDAPFTSDSYFFTLSPDMNNAIITNIITITATAPDGSEQTVQGSFSTIIGNPPTGCFIFNSGSISQVTTTSWESHLSEKQKEMGAVSIILARLGPSNVCGGPINLYLATSGVDVNYGGWYLGGGNIALDFKHGSLGTPNNALYTLAHETGHELSHRLPSVFADFIASGLVYWNGSCINNIYPFPVYLTSEAACLNENFAEGIARFVNPTAKGSLAPNWLNFFQSHFP